MLLFLSRAFVFLMKRLCFHCYHYYHYYKSWRSQSQQQFYFRYKGGVITVSAALIAGGVLDLQGLGGKAEEKEKGR